MIIHTIFVPEIENYGRRMEVILQSVLNIMEDEGQYY